MAKPRKPINQPKTNGLQPATISTQSGQPDDHMQAASHSEVEQSIYEDAIKAQGLPWLGFHSLITNRYYDSEHNKAIRRAWRTIRLKLGIPAPGLHGEEREFQS